MIKTVKDLTLKEIKGYRECLKKREEKKKEYLLERYQEAWSVAKKAYSLALTNVMELAKQVFTNFRRCLGIAKEKDDKEIGGIGNEVYCNN